MGKVECKACKSLFKHCINKCKLCCSMDFIVFTVMSFHTPFLTNCTRLQVWDFNASIKVGVNAALVIKMCLHIGLTVKNLDLYEAEIHF